MGNGVNSPVRAVPEPAAETSESLADQAYREIRDLIVMLDIAPGSPINEDQLGTTLGIGRTPIREALKRLAHERLVVAYARRGTFATDVNITDLAHISEVRAHMEPIAARSAAARATDQQRAEFRAILDELARLGGDPRTARELMLLDLRIHRSLYAAVHNAYLEDTMVRYDNLANRIWCLFIDRLPDLAAHIEEHGPLLEAVIAGDSDRAAELAGKHVRHFESEIRALI